MALSREECEQSLIELTPDPMGIYIGDVMMINQLINVHFDNPPLKFEELKEGMWVWDNKENLYGKVTEEDLWKHGILSIPGQCWGVFEPNRFYRHEVLSREKI